MKSENIYSAITAAPPPCVGDAYVIEGDGCLRLTVVRSSVMKTDIYSG